MGCEARFDSWDWAREEFGHAELGDARRTARLVRMAASLAQRPAGKVVEAFRSNAEQQGAYDFLSNEKVECNELLRAMEVATARRCADESWVHVVVDGTSLRLTDRRRTKGFGGIGSTDNGASGLKVIHAYSVSPLGVPLGVLNQQWWSRARHKKRDDCHRRGLEDKETRHWVESIEQAAEVLLNQGIKPWFQVDREGDRYWTLKALRDSSGWFTVRSTYGHRFVFVQRGSARRRRLRDVARKAALRGVMRLELRERYNRKARTAYVKVQTASVTLDATEAFTEERMRLPVNVVEVREMSHAPRGEARLHWRLLTNHPVATEKDLNAVLAGYTSRWKIEELHRVWKSGACRVEQSQLRTPERAIKWAVLGVSVAARIERLRMLARTEPESPSSVELTEYEMRAIVLLKRRYAKRTETIPDEVPTISTAVRWLADLGGHAGRKTSGPPGAVTIRRGLELVAPVAAVLEMLKGGEEM